MCRATPLAGQSVRDDGYPVLWTSGRGCFMGPGWRRRFGLGAFSGPQSGAQQRRPLRDSARRLRPLGRGALPRPAQPLPRRTGL